MPELWMPGVERVPSVAVGGYPGVDTMEPIGVINHIMQGFQATMIRWARERPAVVKKSAHFTINREGRIIQHAPLNVPTWASGNVASPVWRLLKYDARGEFINPNTYAVNVEHEGFSVDPGYSYDYLYDDDNPWPEAMVVASVQVNAFVCKEFGIVPDMGTIIGHRQTDTITRLDDPGKAWPKERIVVAVQKMLEVGGLPDEITKNQGYWAIYRNGVKPVRIEDKWGIYEIRRRIG